MAVAQLTVTVAAPVAPQLPLCDTLMLTVIGLSGAGLTLMVKETVPPSVMPLPPEMVISGVVGGGLSSSATFTDTDDAEPTV